MARARADVVLTDRGLFPSRERARAAILAGWVRADGKPVSKAGEAIDQDARLEVAAAQEFVSRGGVKLCGALDDFDLDVTGMRAIDVGASTGGFTDCLLQRGAAGVAAVDVGYGQLAWRLRKDERVDVFERTNIRHADPVELGAPFDLAVVDVSFISLEKVLPVVGRCVGDEGEILALVKPQFEAGKGRVGKKGVVRDPRTHREVLEAVVAAARREGWAVAGMTRSPVTGPQGNIEFWIRLTRGEDVSVDIPRLVEDAHTALGSR